MAASTPASRLRATLVGCIAILLWSVLALLATYAGPIPPFELVALTFGIAALAMVALWLVQGGGILRRLALPLRVWALGVGGLFGYHLLYFVALQAAPPVEANLINYTWPLLIVLFSALLPGERLRWWHVAGAVCGLAGTVVLVGGGLRAAPSVAALPGYLAAAAASVTWAGYSVLSRRLGRVPTDAIGGFCAATSVLATLCHLVSEPTVRPDGAGWAAILALGLGPVGLAFYAWDHGVKRGNIKALGGLSYATPLASTLLLVAAGRAEPSPSLVFACLAIVGGAVLASRDLWLGDR